jgi:hypothetical protein
VKQRTSSSHCGWTNNPWPPHIYVSRNDVAVPA